MACRKKKYGGFGDAYTNRAFKRFKKKRRSGFFSGWRDTVRSMW